jgi:hypothetical protein
MKESSLPRSLCEVKSPIPIFEYLCWEAVVRVLQLIVVLTLRQVVVPVLIPLILIVHMGAGIRVSTTSMRPQHVLIVRWMCHMVVIRGQNAVIAFSCL